MLTFKGKDKKHNACNKKVRNESVFLIFEKIRNFLSNHTSNNLKQSKLKASTRARVVRVDVD